jgi:hypothetical protein
MFDDVGVWMRAGLDGAKGLSDDRTKAIVDDG